MIALLERSDGDASLAIDVYVHRTLAGLSAMTAAAGANDALAFSGGVGEHAARIRLVVATGLRFLDVSIDNDSNSSAQPDCEITGNGRVRIVVITAGEDLEIVATSAARPRR